MLETKYRIFSITVTLFKIGGNRKLTLLPNNFWESFSLETYFKLGALFRLLMCNEFFFAEIEIKNVYTDRLTLFSARLHYFLCQVEQLYK
jgi:hypothetical protein